MTMIGVRKTAAQCGVYVNFAEAKSQNNYGVVSNVAKQAGIPTQRFSYGLKLVPSSLKLVPLRFHAKGTRKDNLAECGRGGSD